MSRLRNWLKSPNWGEQFLDFGGGVLLICAGIFFVLFALTLFLDSLTN